MLSLAASRNSVSGRKPVDVSGAGLVRSSRMALVLIGLNVIVGATGTLAQRNQLGYRVTLAPAR